jgi:hypothetical protein
MEEKMKVVVHLVKNGVNVSAVRQTKDAIYEKNSFYFMFFYKHYLGV